MKRNIILLICFYCVVAQVMAQLKLETIAPQSVDLSDGYFSLKYKVNALDVDKFVAPEMEGFRVESNGPYSGAYASVYQQHLNINGKVSKEVSTTFTYTLVPTRTGEFHIGPASVVVDGKTVSSRSVTIKVTDVFKGKSPTKQSLQDYGTATGEKDLFITMRSALDTVYEFQPVLLDCHYHAALSVGLQNIYIKSKPDFKKVITHDLPFSASPNHTHIGNETYLTGTCYKMLVLPQEAGRITIPSIEFECELLKKDPSFDELVDAYFNNGYIVDKVKRRTPEHTLVVKPLPQPFPAGFSKAVGSFALDGAFEGNNLATNDVAVYRLTIEGTGNLKFLSAPDLRLPDSFDVYPPKVKDATEITAEGASGKLICEYTIVPRRKGTFQMPPVEFVYFDPDKAVYDTLFTAPQTLEVVQGVRSDADYEEAQKLMGGDIRGLKPSGSRPSGISWGDWRDWCGLGGVVALFAGLMTIVGLLQRRGQDVVAHRRTKAARMALKKLKRAETLLHAGNGGEFYAEVIRSLHGYLADKFGIPVSELCRERIAQVFREHSLPDATYQQLDDVLERCEFARYAPGIDEDARREHLFEQAIEAIVAVENVLKGRRGV